MKQKKCTKCNQNFPATTDYFYESKTNKIGLRPVCKKCSNKTTTANRAREEKEFDYNSLDRKGLLKVCNKCDKTYPATKDYFFISAVGKYGLRAKCKSCFIEESKILKQTEKYKIKAKEYRKRHYEENKDNYAKRWQEYYKNNREYLLEKQKEYVQNNRDKIRLKDREYRKIPFNRLNDNVSKLIRQSLISGKNNKHWENLIGYKLNQLIKHLEDRFKDGMTWLNYGKYGWHVDHIIPISLWKFESYNDREFKQCWSLVNLQPLWAADNIRKSNKVAAS